MDGYGYGDYGRDQFDIIVARILGAEAALVRLQLFSGTHAIASALFGSLRPGNTMLCVSGPPYDTLEEVIGKRVGSQTGTLTGSLADWGIKYKEIDALYEDQALKANGQNIAFDLDRMDKMLEEDPSIKLIHIQRYTHKCLKFQLFIIVHYYVYLMCQYSDLAGINGAPPSR